MIATFLRLDQIDVGIAIVINAHRIITLQSLLSLRALRSLRGPRAIAATPVRDTSARSERAHQIRGRRRSSRSRRSSRTRSSRPSRPSTRARKASAIRNASTRVSPAPITLISAISRAMCGPSLVRSATRCTGTSRSSCALICSITISVPEVTTLMRAVPVVLDRRDRQAVDVVAAPGEQPDDAREHAGLIVDQHGDGGATQGRSLWVGMSRFRSSCGNAAQTSTMPSSVMPAAALLVLGPQNHLVMRGPGRDHRKAVLRRIDGDIDDHGPATRDHLADHPVHSSTARRACRRHGTHRRA